MKELKRTVEPTVRNFGCRDPGGIGSKKWRTGERHHEALGCEFDTMGAQSRGQGIGSGRGFRPPDAAVVRGWENALESVADRANLRLYESGDA